MLEARGVRDADAREKRPYLYFFMRRFEALEQLAAKRDIFIYPVVGLISVWRSGQGNPFPELSGDDIARLRQPDALLICDYSGDANPLNFTVFNTLFRWSQANGVRLDQIVIMSQNPIPQRRLFDDWVRRRRPGSRLRFGFAHSWLDWTIEAASTIPSKVITDGIEARKTHRFLTLNNAPRAHRVMLVALLQQKAPSETLASLGLAKVRAGLDDPANRAYAPGVRTAFMRLCESDEAFVSRWGWLLDNFDINQTAERAPLSSPKGPIMWRFDEAQYARSMMSIVGETEMESIDYIRISEKSIKPPMFGHPYIIAGNPRSLRLMLSFGFQTYPEIFHENYDKTEDPVQRLYLIFTEIERLSVMGRSVFDDMIHQVREKIFFNSEYGRRGLLPRYRSWLAQHLTDLIQGSQGIRRFREIGPF